MTKTKSTKSALISSVFALFLCFTMLLGTTFAWFTDSVTSSGNIIKSGTLDVEMYYENGNVAIESADWKTAKDVAIFDYDKWEPGYTVAKHIKVSNEGTLDLKYQLAIVPNGEVSKLAEVIDVYYIENGQQIGDRADLEGLTKRGTLADLINTGIANGNLYADGSEKGAKDYVATIVLKMQETAGNEYQNLKIGDSFSIQLLATQLASESDSFGDQYDADAYYELHQDADGAYLILNAADLMAFNAWMNEAGFNGEGRGPYVKLMADIDMTGYDWLSINEMFMTFDGNGHTISNLNCVENGSKSGFFGYLGGATIKNLTLENVTSVGSQAGIFAGQSEGSKIINCNIAGTNYVAWDNDSGDAITKNGIGAYVGVSVDAFEVSGTIEAGTEITMNTNGMTGGWDNVDKYAGGLYNTPQTINVNDLGAITTLTYVAEGVCMNDAGEYLIMNAEGLQYMSATVSTTKGAVNDGVWKLYGDVDMTGVDFTPINNFHGTFDGNGNTISNLTVEASQNAGLFGRNENNGDGFIIPTIKNVNITNATVKGEDFAGILIGRIAAVNIDSVNVTESTVSGSGYIGGIIGHAYGPGGVNMTNCTVTECSISGSNNVGGIGGYVAYGTVTGCAVKDSTVTGSDYYVGSLLGHAGNKADGLLAKVYDNTVSGDALENMDLIGYANNLQNHA